MKLNLAVEVGVAVLATVLSGYVIGKYIAGDVSKKDINDSTTEPINNYNNENILIGNARKVFSVGVKAVNTSDEEVEDVSAEKTLYITNGSGKINKENFNPKNGVFTFTEYEPYCKTALKYIGDSEAQQYIKTITNNPSEGYDEYIQQYPYTIDNKVLLGRAMLKDCKYSKDSNTLFTDKPVEVYIQSDAYLEYENMIPEVRLLSGLETLRVTVNPDFNKPEEIQ